MSSKKSSIAKATHRALSLLVIFGLIGGCAAGRLGAQYSSDDVGGYVTPSILNKEREFYDGQRVRVQGWMRSAPENYAIWESEGSAQKGQFQSDCVALGIPSSMETSSFDKSFVVVEGTFHKDLPDGVIQLGACNYTILTLDLNQPPKELPHHKD